MKKSIGVAALMAMAGYLSMNKLRQEQPYRSFSSAKGVERATECVLFTWQNQSSAGVHYDVSLQPPPSDGRTVVSQRQIEFVDVISTDRGSDISIYFQSGITDWRRSSRIEAAKSCL